MVRIDSLRAAVYDPAARWAPVPRGNRSCIEVWCPEKGSSLPRVTLIGDSIFDNAAYVAGGPDVVEQLADQLPVDWSATLCAVDGALAADVERQLDRVPTDTTHLVLAVGGNDALSHVDILDRTARSYAEVLDQLAGIGESFERTYRRMLQQVLAMEIPLIVSTIYNGRLPDPDLQRRAQTALIVFNDVILRSASAARLPVIELRQVCTEPGDYANPIEPSVQGGRMIATAIREALVATGFDTLPGARFRRSDHGR